MRRSCIIAILSVAVVLLTVRHPLHLARGEAESGQSTWLVLVYNAPTPTPTATPTITPTATPTATPTSMPPHVYIAAECSQFDVPGNDGDRYNEEYVCFANDGGQTATMTDWRVRDAAGNTYTFPAFYLPCGQRVRLHTGSGTNTATDLYWGQRRFIWNNNGDTVYLYNSQGVLMDQYTY